MFSVFASGLLLKFDEVMKMFECNVYRLGFVSLLEIIDVCNIVYIMYNTLRGVNHNII